MIKSYKFRLYPNAEQRELIEKTFGCCRFVYNKILSYKIEKYKNDNITLSKFDCNNYCNSVLKKQYNWLKEVDKCALTNAIYNIDMAYRMFFSCNSKYPQFKSKKNQKKTYKTQCNNAGKPTIEIDFENNRVKIPKLKWVKCVAHRQFNGTIKSAVISKTPSGKYFVSLNVDVKQIPQESIPNACIGLDLGIKDLLITSDGEKFDNVRTTKRYEDILAKAQRKLSHKVKGSKNWDKQRIKVAKIHEKIHNTRTDNLHKISCKLINENQVIVSEDLAISNMVKNHNLAKAIFDCSWGEFIRQLQYKSEWNGRQYIKIDRFFASSQICNECGYINKDIKNLSIRSWTCLNCGTVHDRDVNAAINILNYGLNLLKQAG